MEHTSLDQLEEVVSGEYTIQPRMMLHAIVKKPEGIQEFSALNDIVISRGEQDRMVDINVEMKNGFVNSYRADGLIFLLQPVPLLTHSVPAVRSFIPPSKVFPSHRSVRIHCFLVRFCMHRMRCLP